MPLPLNDKVKWREAAIALNWTESGETKERMTGSCVPVMVKVDKLESSQVMAPRPAWGAVSTTEYPLTGRNVGQDVEIDVGLVTLPTTIDGLKMTVVGVEVRYTVVTARAAGALESLEANRYIGFQSLTLASHSSTDRV